MTDEVEAPQDWYFTFGCAHQHPNGYVKIRGTFGSAREEMMNRFGRIWAFQYDSPEHAGVDEYNLYEVK